ncbi:MAG: hypothetical protein ACTS7E_01875 [Arsenophonus sp. NC-CH8-MAG3]
MALIGLTIADKFCDQGRNVLLFIDNIYCYILALTKVSSLLDCTAFGNKLSTDLSRRNRYIAKAHPSTKAGSITSIQVAYVPAMI